MGAGNEQSEEQSAGDRESGGHLRLDYYDRNNEDKSLPFFGGDDTIREILGTTPHLKASKDEIRAFYEGNPDNAARIEYIKGIFNNDYTELILSDGRRVGYKTWQNVLQLWEGNYADRIAQGFYDWSVIAQHFEAMRLLGELQDTRKPLPSMDGQLNFLDMQAEEKTSAFSFSQEIIDTVLARGSGVSEGKFRIYEQFEKSLSAKENADFLKDEYGWGGAYPVIVGAGIDEQHDGKGILISKGIGDDKPHIRLTWTQVEKRIKELIRLDRYLNPKEKEIYPQWLEKQEERRAELAEEQRNREILSSAPPEQETVQAAESEPQQEAQYAYHLGDTVYIEYDTKLQDEKTSVSYDVLEMSGSRAVWKEVLAVYSVKVNTDPDNPQEVATMDESKKQLLTDIFWEMNEIRSSTDTKTETVITETDDGHGNIVETESTVTQTYLYITVSHKTADEMAAQYGFNEEQKEYLAELLADENNSLWSQVLYGITGTDDQIVTVALSQIGTMGGDPYWSWYGFNSRVEWCACFVSWCANECGYIDAGVIPKYAGCVNGVQWFKDRGQWLDNSAEPTPGMIIFFDWASGGQDGLSDHTGIVQKVENGRVYTVEGNSGDSVRQNSYPVGYYEILGYGAPAY